MSATTWRPLPVIARELGVPESFLHQRARAVPSALRLRKIGGRRVMFIDADRLFAGKAKIKQHAGPGFLAPQWGWTVPLPDGETVSGFSTTHASAVNHVSILIKAWWHR